MKIDKGNFDINEFYFEYNQKVNSISQYLGIVDFINLSFFDAIWFRGHSNHEFKLIPTFTRLSSSKTTENNLIESFISRGRSIIPQEIKSLWDVYQIMQHYGCPTRLLDWTESSLIALFFALNDNTNDGSVWLLEPGILNMTSNFHYGVYYPDKVFIEDDLKLLDTYLSPEKGKIPSIPLALKAKWIDSRMANQQCCFTIHGFINDGFKNMFNEKKILTLCKLIIDKSAKEKLKMELKRSGINEFIVYPNLEGLSRHLKNELF